jgi:hypothetical protein
MKIHLGVPRYLQRTLGTKSNLSKGFMTLRSMHMLLQFRYLPGPGPTRLRPFQPRSSSTETGATLDARVTPTNVTLDIFVRL